MDLDEIARGECDENFVRKDFTPSEAVAIAEALTPKIKAEAKARQREHGGTAPGKHSGQIATSDKGRARDKAAAFTGIAARTLAKAIAVVQALRADPQGVLRGLAELGLPRRLAEVGVAEDRFELIGKNAMLSIFTRANPQPIREPGDVVKILKLAA